MGEVASEHAAGGASLVLLSRDRSRQQSSLEGGAGAGAGAGAGLSALFRRGICSPAQQHLAGCSVIFGQSVWESAGADLGCMLLLVSCVLLLLSSVAPWPSCETIPLCSPRAPHLMCAPAAFPTHLSRVQPLSSATQHAIPLPPPTWRRRRP